MLFTITEIEQKEVQELTVNIADSISALIDISNTKVHGILYQVKTFAGATQTVTPSKILAYKTADGSDTPTEITIDDSSCDFIGNSLLLVNSATPAEVVNKNKLGFKHGAQVYSSVKYVFNASEDGAIIYIVPMNTGCVHNPVK